MDQIFNVDISCWGSMDQCTAMCLKDHCKQKDSQWPPKFCCDELPFGNAASINLQDLDVEDTTLKQPVNEKKKKVANFVKELADCP